MNSTQKDFGYQVKYALLTVNLTSKKNSFSPLKASIKYLIKLENPNLTVLEISTNGTSVSEITLEGIKIPFEIDGQGNTNILLPHHYQVDEFSILEIKYTAAVTTSSNVEWTLESGAAIPSINGYESMPINELKVIAFKETDFSTQEATMMGKEILPVKQLFHYAVSDINKSIALKFQ
jgi:hypothetical protein